MPELNAAAELVLLYVTTLTPPAPALSSHALPVAELVLKFVNSASSAAHRKSNRAFTL